MTDKANEIDTGGPAFPADEEAHTYETKGMTLRDYFAGQALIGFITNTEWLKKYVPQANTIESQTEFIASFAYHLADEMLTERWTKY